LMLPKISMRVALVSAAVVIVLLAAGFTGYRVLGVVEPIERAIAQIDEVVGCKVESVRSGAVVTVRLSGVTDLADTVQRIASAASGGNRAGASRQARQVWLKIEAEPDAATARAMQEMDFWVHEALATGKFTQLPRAATLIKASAGLDRFDVGVDSDYVYVSMANDGAELYRVIPRAGRPEGAVEPGGGIRIW